jgi:hypothetical protein
MADTYVIGNDGAVTLPTAGADSIHVRSFAATISRVESDLTGFGDSGKRRRLGIIDLTGSLNGVPKLDPEGTVPTAATSQWFVSDATGALTLTIYDNSVATNDAKIAANCIFNGHAFNMDKNGDASLTCNFSNADGAAPVVTWLV